MIVDACLLSFVVYRIGMFFALPRTNRASDT